MEKRNIKEILIGYSVSQKNEIGIDYFITVANLNSI